MTSFVLALFRQSVVLGAVGAIAIGGAGCMILYAALLKAVAYRSLGNVERLRAVLVARGSAIEVARAHALEWLGQVGDGVANTSAVARLIQGAGTVVELRGILRNRVADPLRERAAGLGRRAAAEGATLVAICPHPAWDGLIAGVRGLLVIRGVASAIRPAAGPGRHLGAAAARGVDDRRHHRAQPGLAGAGRPRAHQHALCKARGRGDPGHRSRRGAAVSIPARMCGRPLGCKGLLLDLLSGAAAVMCPAFDAAR